VESSVVDLDADDESASSTYELRYRAYLRNTGEDQRAKFLQKLFDGDAIRMETTIGEVLGSETWKIAASRLDRFYMTNGVKPDNAMAMELTHSLNRSFR